MGAGRATTIAALSAGLVVTLFSTADRVGLPVPAAGPYVGASRARGEALALAQANPASPAAAAAAAEAVALNPVGRGALSLLASLRAASGDGPGAGAAFAASARGGWRDPLTQAWALEQALATGDTTVAVDRVEALLRTVGDGNAGELPAALTAIARNPAARAAFARRLGSNPPWGAALFRNMTTDVPDAVAARLDLASAAAASGWRPAPRVAADAVGSIYQRMPLAAWQLWQALASADERRGGFPSVAQGFDDQPAAFAWRVAGSDTLQTELQAASGGTRAVVTGSNAVRVTVADRQMALSPGRHVLRWRESGAVEPHFDVELLCAVEGGPIDNGDVPPVRGGERTRAVVVPATCPIGVLRIAALPYGDMGGERWITAPVITPS